MHVYVRTFLSDARGRELEARHVHGRAGMGCDEGQGALLDRPCPEAQTHVMATWVSSACTEARHHVSKRLLVQLLCRVALQPSSIHFKFPSEPCRRDSSNVYKCGALSRSNAETRSRRRP